MLNVGDKIKVFIIDMDKGKNKVSSALRKKIIHGLKQEMFNVGDIVNAKIVRLVSSVLLRSFADGGRAYSHIPNIYRKNT